MESLLVQHKDSKEIMNKEVREKLKAAGVLAAPTAEPEEKELSPAERDRQEGIERRTRLRQMEQEESEERAKRIAANLAASTPRNSNYDELGNRIVVIKPSVALKPINEELQKRDQDPPQKPFAEVFVSDPLAAREPEYVRSSITPISATAPKPSVALKPRPAPQDSLKRKHEPTPVETQVVNTQERLVPEPTYGTKKCPGCGEEVAVNKIWHTNRSGERCIVDAEAARHEGFVATA